MSFLHRYLESFFVLAFIWLGYILPKRVSFNIFARNDDLDQYSIS